MPPSGKVTWVPAIKHHPQDVEPQDVLHQLVLHPLVDPEDQEVLEEDYPHALQYHCWNDGLAVHGVHVSPDAHWIESGSVQPLPALHCQHTGHWGHHQELDELDELELAPPGQSQ